MRVQADAAAAYAERVQVCTCLLMLLLLPSAAQPQIQLGAARSNSHLLSPPALPAPQSRAPWHLWASVQTWAGAQQSSVYCSRPQAKLLGQGTLRAAVHRQMKLQTSWSRQRASLLHWACFPGVALCQASPCLFLVSAVAALV